MVSVRELRPEDDLNSVLDLCKGFFAEYEDHHDEFFDTDELTDNDISARFLESLESDRTATLIAIADGKIVGYASLSVREQPRFYKVKKIGAISALMVTKEYRRRGIATRLIAEARLYFRRQGVKYYTFYTAASNQTAIRFYEKIGVSPLHVSFLGET